MRLQFAFGANPKKRGKKKVAKRVKRKQNKRVSKKRGLMAKRKKAKHKKRGHHAKKRSHKKHGKRKKVTVRGLRSERDSIAKKLKSKRKAKKLSGKIKKSLKKKLSSLRKQIKKKTGRNPYYKWTAKDATGRVLQRNEFPDSLEMDKKLKRKFSARLGKIKKAEAKSGQTDVAARSKIAGEMAEIRRQWKEDLKGQNKDIEAYKATAGVTVEGHAYEKRKKKKKKKKAAKKTTASRKPKKKKKAKNYTRGGKRYIQHAHPLTTRHLKKGAKGSVKLTKKKKGRTYKGTIRVGGKKGAKLSITMSPKKKGYIAKIKVNPRRRKNPMANILETVSEPIAGITGVSVASVGSAILGGALIPAVNMAIPAAARIPVVGPFVSQGVGMINSVLGPQAASSLIPLLAGAGMIKFSQNEIVHQAGMGMVVAGIVGLTTSIVQKGLQATGLMSGVLYTPRLSGINYTPDMRGINYTPNMGIMPQLGVMPQLGNRADFGSADYGGGGGYTPSRSDFGADFSEDSEAEHWGTEEDMLTSQMGGLV